MRRPFDALARLWRGSIQFRAVAIATALTWLSMIAFGAYMSFSVRNDLFSSRLEQVLSVSDRAATAAQSTLSASSATDTATIQELLNRVLTDVEGTTSTHTVSVLRGPQALSGYTQDLTSGGLSRDDIPAQMRDSVSTSPSGLWWQSSEIGGKPVIVVGTGLVVQVAGTHELFMVFDLSDEAATLSFVQQILNIGGAVLAVLIGGITWLVVSLVVRPVRVIAETSRRLAEGDLAQRVTVVGRDEAATLGAAFNQMADSIQRQIIQLETLSTMQQRFVSDVSHELRTPLTTIRLASEVIYSDRDDLEPTQRRSAELLHNQVERFEELLSDLLEISRFDSGSATLDTKKFELRSLVSRVVNGLSPLATSLGSELRIRAPKTKVLLVADETRIERIVRNLVANAIEHGEGKPIDVWVGADKYAAAVAVRDYGVGIARENLTRVFERFWRADPSRQRTIGGTGLGLSIAREDTNLHNGWLEVWSKPGLGSCFRLTIPREPNRSIASSPIALPPRNAQSSSRASADAKEAQ